MRKIHILCALLFCALAARTAHANLVDEMVASQKDSAIHFMFSVNNIEVKRLLKPNATGDSTCKVHGEIIQMFNPGPGQAVFKTGDVLAIKVGCSQTDYPLAPGSFGLGPKALTAARIEFWGDVGKDKQFVPFEARY